MNGHIGFWGVYDKVINFLMAISAVLIIFITLAVAADVLSRYIFNVTYVALFEISEYSLLWITFLGTPWIMRNNGHVRVDLVVSHLGKKQRTIMNFVASVICTLMLLLLFIISARLNLNDFLTNYALTGILQPPKWPLEIIVPIGFLLLALQMLRMTHESWVDLKNLSGSQNKNFGSEIGGAG